MTQVIEIGTEPHFGTGRAPLRALVHAWAKIANVHHAALWPQVKGHFQLSRIDDLPVEWLPDALAFVQAKIDALSKALPGAAHAPQMALPGADSAPALIPVGQEKNRCKSGAGDTSPARCKGSFSP